MLEEIAKLWKSESGPVIVEDGDKLKSILKTLEGCMKGGKVGLVKTQSNLSRQSSFAFGNDSAVDLSDDSKRPTLDGHRNSSFGLSKLQVGAAEDDPEEIRKDPTAWLEVVSAFKQPRFSYNVDNKHFTPLTNRPSIFPSASHRTTLFQERYNIIQQRLLRNPAFQAPSFSASTSSLARRDSTTAQQFYKITPVANLLGRGGSSHLLLGMLTLAPTGTLVLTDLSGSISLDLQHAKPLQGDDSSYFCPGMIVLVDGVYEEDWAGAGASGLGATDGVGGTIGGRFIGFSIGSPPVEKRHVSLGINLNTGDVGGGFGWTDFLGVGSDRAVGTRMRRIEQQLLGPDVGEAGSGRRKMIMLSELTLDQPQSLVALRRILERYSSSSDESPLCFLLVGNFASSATMAGAGTGSIEYKEMFNELAALLPDFPTLLRSSKWIFVPGDNDPWSAAFSAGASALIPKDGVPELFTSRVKRAFATAKTEASRQDTPDGEAIWTTNPARLSLFGPVHEVAVLRDDIAGRFRRSAVRIGQAVQQSNEERPPPNSISQEEDIVMSGALPTMEADPEVAEAMTVESPAPILEPAAETSEDEYGTLQAKKLIMSLLPQSTLSPFPLTTRPIHWDYNSALSLYPLPHTLVLADAESAPFALTFEGCHVVNPGRLVSGSGRRKKVQWIEYDCWTKRGTLMQDWIG